MSSHFLKKLEEEKKLAQSGQPLDSQMQEEDEDYDEEENQDQVNQSLQGQTDGVGALMKPPSAPSNKPMVIKANHNISMSKPSGPPPSGIPKPPGGQGSAPQATKYDPVEWNKYYDSMEMLDGKIPVYYAGENTGHLFFCLHGAGHTAQSFAALAGILKSQPYDATVVSFDFRGHGGHFCDNETEMSQQTLINETIYVLQHVIKKYPNQSVIMCGHSMGGSIATKTVDYIYQNPELADGVGNHIKALYVIDVVEGSAMDALPFMEQIVCNRPSQFSSLQSVVKYGVNSNTVRNLTSARVSMPPQVVKKTDTKGKELYYWRTDLLASKQYWTEWFTGLTETFLNIKLPKQLLLAGNDRMDKELTIAHMQGKFKMVVVDNVGHVIQEDRPDAVATSFMQMIEKFRIQPNFKQQMVITSMNGKKIVINQ